VARLGGIGLAVVAAIGLGGASSATHGTSLAGEFDPGFGSNGRAFVSLGAYDFIGPLVGPAVQRGGKLVFAGTGSGKREPPATSTGTDLLLVRLRASGRLDRSFGHHGATRVRVRLARGGQVRLKGLAVGPSGKTVVVGHIRTKRNRIYWLVAQFLANGRPDPRFGARGVHVLLPPGRARFDDAARGVAVQANGRIVVAGSFGPAGWALIRLLPNGRLDRSFGSHGMVRTAVGDSRPSDAPFAVALLPRGRIAVGGGADGYPGDSHFAVARYLSNGALDRSFGSNGTVVLPNVIGRDDVATDLLALPGEKLLAAGYDTTYDPAYANFRMARFLRGGGLDQGFGNGGIVSIPFEHVELANALSVARQPDGKLVVAGTGDWDWHEQAALLARYTPNGALDPSFGQGGWRLYDFCQGVGAGPAALQRVARRLRIVQIGTVHCNERHQAVVIGVRVSGRRAAPGQYRVVTSSGRPLVPGTKRFRLRCRYCTTPITLPWAVRVYGRSFRRAYVSPVGNLQFDTSSESDDHDYCVPSGLLGTAIVPYWTDLYVDKASGIWTRVLGKKPHRTFVLEWRHFEMEYRGAVTFEILFREGSTTLTTIYGAGSWSGNYRGFAAGVQTDGALGVGYLCTDPKPAEGLEADYVWQP
jgi:uncharacterized delta-60 repeat protein